MNSKEYADYRATDAWRERRNACLNDHGYRCQVCGCTSWRRIVDVHHLHYRNVGNEQPDDLVPLCSIHHALIHQQSDGYDLKVVRRLAKECDENNWDDPMPAFIRESELRSTRRQCSICYSYLDGDECRFC